MRRMCWICFSFVYCVLPPTQPQLNGVTMRRGLIHSKSGFLVYTLQGVPLTFDISYCWHKRDEQIKKPPPPPGKKTKNKQKKKRKKITSFTEDVFILCAHIQGWEAHRFKDLSECGSCTLCKTIISMQGKKIVNEKYEKQANNLNLDKNAPDWDSSPPPQKKRGGGVMEEEALLGFLSRTHIWFFCLLLCHFQPLHILLCFSTSVLLTLPLSHSQKHTKSEHTCTDNSTHREHTHTKRYA